MFGGQFFIFNKHQKHLTPGEIAFRFHGAGTDGHEKSNNFKGPQNAQKTQGKIITPRRKERVARQEVRSLNEKRPIGITRFPISFIAVLQIQSFQASLSTVFYPMFGFDDLKR